MAELGFEARLCGSRPNLEIPAAFKPIFFCLNLDGLVLHSSPYSFNKSYLSTYLVSGSWLCAGDTVAHYTEVTSDLMDLTLSGG